MAIAPFESVGDVVTFNNTKMFGDTGSHLAAQAGQAYGASNARLNMLGESSAAAWVNRQVTPDPVEAISTQKMMTGSDSKDISESMALAKMLVGSPST